MIPKAYITEWSNNVPWQTNEQVEQDLVICRTLVEIYSDNWLASSLAFRGGTALHKLFLQPQPRYSEDIDLVQIRPEPIKETIQRIQQRLSFLNDASVESRKDGIRLKYRFESEFPPVHQLRLKVEINTREHFKVLNFKQVSFNIACSWFTGYSTITTYQLEELLGTKLRALYQRKKGRDLYDLHKALLHSSKLDKEAIVKCYRKYMQFSVEQPPTRKQYLLNMEAKMLDAEFRGDITALIRPEETYDQIAAYELIKTELIEKI